MHVSKVEETARRLEIFTGSGRRRNWSAEDKAAIITESYGGVETVCAVARRHGLTPSQLFAWRRQARRSAADEEEAVPPAFVPAIVETTASNETDQERGVQGHAGRCEPDQPVSGIIEVAMGGVMVRVGRGAEAKMVAAVIRALKADA
jgi:transposase